MDAYWYYYSGATVMKLAKKFSWQVRVTRGRCYDHNFLRFLTISGEKIGVFITNQCYDQNFAYFSFVLSQKRQFFADFFGDFFGEFYSKNHNIDPRLREFSPKF
jgi:hypothetical protein